MTTSVSFAADAMGDVMGMFRNVYGALQRERISEVLNRNLRERGVCFFERNQVARAIHEGDCGAMPDPFEHGKTWNAVGVALSGPMVRQFGFPGVLKEAIDNLNAGLGNTQASLQHN